MVPMILCDLRLCLNVVGAPLKPYLAQVKLVTLHNGSDQSEVEDQLSMALEGEALVVSYILTRNLTQFRKTMEGRKRGHKGLAYAT